MPSTPAFYRTALFVTAGLAWLGSALPGQGLVAPSLVRQHPAINYASAPESNPIQQLNTRLRAGEVTLEAEPVSGYLRSVLKALDIREASQVLVFSKTSFQARRITPANPRAIYFNDDTYVGMVRTGDVLEFIGQDRHLGSIFYTMKIGTPASLHGGNAAADVPVPQAERNDLACVSCHVSDATHNVPGPFIGSVFPGVDGTTQYGPAYTTDHRSPFELRWGGWYVTGTHAADRHMGNAVVTDPTDIRAMITPRTVHVTSLDGRFEPAGYPTLSSDIVALMVLEHQAAMSNLLTRVGWEARLGKDATRPLAEVAAEAVDYMLFIDEAPVPGPLAGTSAFAKTFTARGPFDRQGRTLRQLDTRARLMTYPCSYMIYSAQFDALPEAAKRALYARLWDVLSGAETHPRYASLSPADRQAILEILRETKKDLPVYFGS